MPSTWIVPKKWYNYAKTGRNQLDQVFKLFFSDRFVIWCYHAWLVLQELTKTFDYDTMSEISFSHTGLIRKPFQKHLSTHIYYLKSYFFRALFGYDGMSNDLKFVSKGDGGLTELIDDFNSGKIQYAFLKVDVPNGSIPKCVLINWQVCWEIR